LDGMKHSATEEGTERGDTEVRHSLKRAVQAEELFRKATASGDARSRLVAWAKDHPKIAHSLQHFGDERFLRVRRLREQLKGYEKTLDPEKVKEDTKNLYDLAFRAFELAADLEPLLPTIPADSTRRIRLMAIVEENNGAHQSAYELASRSIDTAQSG